MSLMSPVGVGTSPSIIEQALPSPITPITPAASWASPDNDYEDPLEQFVDNLSPGVGTNRRSISVNNTPPAGVGTPLRTSTPVPTQGNVARVGVTAFGTRAIPGRAATPPGQTYLTGAERGKRAAVARKEPRRVPRQDMPSTPSDAGSPRRSSASGGRRSGGSGGCRSGGGGDSTGDDEDDNDDKILYLVTVQAPQDTDVGDELTGSSMTPKCNNSWHKYYKINAKRLRVDALRV